MKLKKEILKKSINIAKNQGPSVSYKYEVIGDIFKKYFCVRRREDVILGKVLSLFGYDVNDNIYLTSVIYENNNIVVYFLVNGEENEYNKITIKLDDLIFKYRMIVEDKDREFSCQVTVFDRKDINFLVSNTKEKLDNGNIYSREYNSYCAVYKVIVNDMEVEFNIKTDLFDESGFGKILNFEKDVEIENYLKNIDLSKGIENIYKDLFNYLGDVYKYFDIKLSISALNKKAGDNKLRPVVMDMINVKYGVFEQFMITRGNTNITVDKEGNAVCRYADEFVEVVTSINEFDGATYSIKSSNEIVLCEQAFIHGMQGLENAIDEIDEAKEKVLRLIPKKW